MDAEKFALWVEEHSVGTRNVSRPSEEQLACLLSVKGFPQVIDYMIKHVRPVQEWRHIRNNLKNHHFRKHLAEERNMSENQKKYSMMKSLVEDAEKELFTETEDLRRIVEEEQRLELEEKNVRSQIALFDIACKEREESIEKLKKQNEVISLLLPESHKFVSPQDESIKQEAASVDIDVILNKLKALRIEILENKSEDFHDQKMEVWDLVETLIGSHSSASVMKALSSIITRDTNQILQTTSTVDLVADAEALSLKYSNGVFTDVLNPHGMVETVESMVLEMSTKHVKQHLALHKLKQDTKKTKESVEGISSSIQSILNDQQHNDPLIVSGIVDLFKATVRVSGLKASISAASSMITDLETKAEIARRGKEAIEEKYNRISNFEDTVEYRNTELKELVVAISNSLKEVEEEKAKVALLVKSSLDSIVLPTPFLKGAFSKECEAVMNMPFEVLATVQNEHGRTPMSSIGPVDDLHSDLSKLSEVVPYVTSWENVFETVRQQKARLRQNETRLTEEFSDLETRKKNGALQPLSSFAVKALQQNVQSHDQRLEEDLLPLLQKCEETNEKGEKIVARFKQVVDEWWSQPGPEMKQYLKVRRSGPQPSL